MIVPLFSLKEPNVTQTQQVFQELMISGIKMMRKMQPIVLIKLIGVLNLQFNSNLTK